jgi:hypothetical protein
MNKVLSAVLRGGDQIITTIMDDLVWGKKARRGSRMSRSVLKATKAPKVRRTRSSYAQRSVVVHVYAGAHVNM